MIPKNATKAQSDPLGDLCFLCFLWRNKYSPRRVAVAFYGDAPDVGRKGVVSHAFGPLDHEDRFFVTQQFIEVNGVRGAGAFVEAVEIDVVELQAAGVRVYECEGGTGDVFFRDAQRRTDSFHEDRLAGAEWTTEQQNLTAFKPRAESVPVVECRFRR